MNLILNITEQQYKELYKSNMFWEWFPEACGKYDKDREYVVFRLNQMRGNK